MKGFSLLELMVGLIILAVGILGFSGMTILMTRGTTQAQKLDEAATLTQSRIEDLAAVRWADLGTNTSLPAPGGLANAEVLTEGPINRNGDAIGTGQGPYLYYRHVVICSETDTVTAGTAPEYCSSSVGGTKRPPELACSGLGLSAREKMIRVIVAWNERSGECKLKAVDSLAFQ
jgi:prepilin-type N-terminal cleavage/methylation domain-containing protein